jgi:hypothetical protein
MGVRSMMETLSWLGSTRITVARSTQGICSRAARRFASGTVNRLWPTSPPKTESRSARVSWLLPMVWMADGDAMRKRGS